MNAPSRRRLLPGRFEQLRLFGRYYLRIVGSFFLLIVLVNATVSRLYPEYEQGDLERLLRGTVGLVRAEYLRTAPEQWPALTAQLSREFGYPIVLNPAPLPLSARTGLIGRDWAIDEDDVTAYLKLPGRQTVRIGPLREALLLSQQRWLSPEKTAELVALLLLCIAYGLVLYRWYREFWRDIVGLLTTAEKYAAGEFSARPPPAETELFGPLSRGFRRMAGRIETLMASRQAMSQALSHELRTPIARLRFGLEMYLEADDDAERERQYAGLIGDLDELERLIETSLTWARIQRGDTRLARAPLTLAPWLAELVAPLERAAPDTVFGVDAADGLTASVDADQLGMAVRNLVTNAVKYGGGTVAIAAARADGAVRLTVEDDGPGIPEDVRERIFEPFFRLDASRTKSRGGYGLGLALARAVTLLHGGTLAVDASPALGGARFTLTLPDAAPAEPDA
ncbi:hypothetical protein AVW16_13250 [Crenobacter luteus]|uniref:histidine kinase n=2 Tax=Crenobacter luteus TaxID=1452487 RepID=A0A163C328_9NEIS|nr:ATP-binding protein [Crenobacter luteus]KZE29773.1 hypothetical protein AVW16_13250 [Crenobacter luteus]